MVKIFISLLFLAPLFLFGQSIDTEFGKNRVQFNNDFKYWSKYETENFIVYWYGDGKYIAQSAIQIAEIDHDEIRKLIEHKINDKIEIVMYTDVSDQKQSNIGTQEAFHSKSGETEFAGTRMLVYFNGDHSDLRRQIREGIASVYLTSLKFGSNFQEFLQNAVLLDLPLWFEKGLISYAGENWNILYEDELRDLFHQKAYFSKFDKISVKYPKIAGHSLWNYIAINYGKSTISDLLYLTRISRDIDNSFRFVFNKSKEEIYKEWSIFYKNKFDNENGVFTDDESDLIKLNKKKWVPTSTFELNADGSKILYATNDRGRIKIRMKDINNGKDVLLFKTGVKNIFQETEYEYPQFSWHPTSNEICFTYRKKDNINLARINLNTLEKEIQVLPNDLRNIESVSYVNDRYFIMSAFVDGTQDLILYDSKYREFRKITEDYYDDLDAQYINFQGSNGILFSSNRRFDHILPEILDTTLPLNNFDLFFYDLEIQDELPDFKKMPKTLTRITNTEDANERHPKKIANQKIAYISDNSGIQNLYVYDEISNEEYNISNSNRNIIRMCASKENSIVIYTKYIDGAYQCFFKNVNFSEEITPFYTSFVRASNKKNETTELKSKEQTQLLEGMLFQSQFPDPPNIKPIKSDEKKLEPVGATKELLSNRKITEEDDVIKINPVKISATGIKFRLDNVATRLDNEVLFEGLELFDPSNSGTKPLPMGILAKASLSDILDDYKLEGGVRIPTTFNGSEYFLVYDNNKKLIDRRIGVYRRSITITGDPNLLYNQKKKNETLLGLYRLKYPFNIYSSLRGTCSLRSDKSYYKVGDDVSFNAPIISEKRIGIRIEYVYDNSYEYDLNLLHGTRFKIYNDVSNQFNFEFADGLNVDLSKGFTGVLGFDARHYIPVLNHSVFAIRLAGAASYGSKRNIYYLGGVANSLFNNFEDSTPLPSSDQFAFQTNVNQMRGFYSNIRNGSNYLVSNIEMRMPLFKYILGKDKGTAFFRNFQLIGFFDSGVAWYGTSPYSDENPINTVNIDGNVVQLEVKYFRDPLVAGYGFGVRTSLLGYFIKFDYARGIETRKVLKGKYYLSFGTDF